MDKKLCSISASLKPPHPLARWIRPPLHTDARGMKSSTRLRLPHGLFVSPQENTAAWTLTSCPLENKEQETSGPSCRAFADQFSGTRVSIKSLLYKSHKPAPARRTCKSTSPCASNPLFGHVFFFCGLKDDRRSFQPRK